MRKKIPRCEGASGEDEEVFQLDLEGFTPSEKDCDGISLLSQLLFPSSSTVNAKQLAEYIIAQSVGTVVKPSESSDDDEDNDDDDGPGVVFAFTSAIDLSVEEGNRCAVVKALRNWLIQLVRVAKPCSEKDGVLSLLESGNGNTKPFFLLNERFENLPLSVCAQAVAGLPAELNEAKLNPTHMIMVSRASREEASMKYAYPEMEFIRPYAIYDLELPNRLATDESDGGFDMFILTVISMDRFDDLLVALESHV